MGDIYRHDINLKDKQSIVMLSKRSTPYDKAELARLLYMQGYKDQTTGLRVNTSPTPVVLYGSTGNNTDGAITQKATTDALLALAETIPEVTINAVTGNIWTGYKLTINKLVILVGTCTNTSTGTKTFNFGFTFASAPFLSTGYTGATGPVHDGVGIGDIANRSLNTTSFTYTQRYSNRGNINFIAIGLVG